MEIIFIKTEKALAISNINIADFVLNPYRGCYFGCLYCYSRANKNINKIKKTWGEFIYIKENFVQILKNEIEKNKNIKRILIGSTTDPLQYFEEKFKIFENIIDILKFYKIPVTILTKSVLIKNFVDKLKYSNNNIIYLTFNSGIVRLLFEPKSFKMEERIEAMKIIRANNINLIAYISPVFPYLTNESEILEKLNGIVKNVYFENYNIKLGNWDEVKTKLDRKLLEFYNKIFFNKAEYENFWQNFIKSVENLNKKFNFNIKFFIYPFNSYY